MVLFFTSTDPTSNDDDGASGRAMHATRDRYMGKDKVENEDLIKFAHPEQDVWFHVDKLSSAHVYLRIPPPYSPQPIPTQSPTPSQPSTAPTQPQPMTWQTIPQSILNDCAQLVKANSIEGNKRDNITVIFTPAGNLKKTGAMEVGQVGFHDERKVKRVHVPTRLNAAVNRLNKTKVERVVDHELEKVEREREEARVKRAAAIEKKNAELELARQRKSQAESYSYNSVFKDFDKTSRGGVGGKDNKNNKKKTTGPDRVDRVQVGDDEDEDDHDEYDANADGGSGASRGNKKNNDPFDDDDDDDGDFDEQALKDFM